MATDMGLWVKKIKSAVSWVADEAAQRRAWFLIGPEVDSPLESFMGFLHDAVIEEFVLREDTGFTDAQLQALKNLYQLVDDLFSQTLAEGFHHPGKELKKEFIDDPRWQRVIAEAKKTEAIIGKAEPR